MKNPSVNYLKIGQAAKALGVSIDTLRRWEKAGKIKAVRTPGGTRLYHISTLKKVNPVFVEDFQAKSLNTEELLKRANEQNLPTSVIARSEATWQSTAEDPSLIVQDDKLRGFKKSRLTKFLIGFAVLSVITIFLTSWITASYLTQPKAAQQFFKNNVASGLFLPFHALAEEVITVIDPGKAKELGFAQSPEPPPSVIPDLIGNLYRSRIKSGMTNENVLAVTASSQFLEVNSDTQINGSLFVRDAVNGLSLEATPSANSFVLGSGDTTLTVTNDALLDQDVSTTSSPTFNTLNLSATSNQLVFQSGGPTGTLTWTPTAARVITLPDATGTVLLDSATQTITNKTINASNNTITNIPNSALSNNKVTVTAGTNLTGGGDINLGSSATLALKDSISLSGTLAVTGATTLSSTLTVGGVVKLADGTAAAPALTFTNDTDTGLYRIGANSIGLITGGSATSGITIDASGNVGIGTISPSYTLDVTGRVNGSTALCIGGDCKTAWSGSAGNTASNGLTLSGVDVQLGGSLTRATGIDIASQNFGFLGGNVGIGTTSAGGSLVVASGNVGIGFTSPDRTTQIASDINITSSLASLLGANGTQFGITGSTAANLQKKLTFGLDTTDNYGVIQVGNTSGTAYGLVLNPAGGNIGIGTTNLNARIAGTSAPILRVVKSDGVSGGTIEVQNTTSGGGDSTVDFIDENGNVRGNIAYYARRSANDPARFVINQGWSEITTLNTVLNENGGNVGIGITGPGSLLAVSGNATIGWGAGTIAGPSNGLGISGSLGVGTTSPNNKLQVIGAGVFGGDFGQYSAPTNGLLVQGNVGIGATTSSNKLDVWGNARIAGTTTIDSTLTALNGLIGYSGVTAPSNGLAVSGNLGIGTTSPAAALEVIGAAILRGNLTFNADNAYDIGAAGATRPRTGYFGTSLQSGLAMNSDVSDFFGTPMGYFAGDASSNIPVVVVGTGANTYGAEINGLKTRATSTNANTIVQNNDELMALQAFGADGASYRQAAGIYFYVDGTPGSSDMPGRIDFATSPDGTNLPITRMTIKNTGNIGIGATLPQAKLVIQGNVGIGYTGVNQAIPDNGLAVFGNVGVGTTSPGYKLDVIGQINGSTGLCIAGDCKTAWSGVGGYTASNGLTLSSTDFQLGGSLTRATGIDINSQNFGFLRGSVGIGTTNPGSALTVIGNVGIGTSAAGAALQVNGGGLFGWGTASSALSSGAIAAFNGNVGIGTTSPAANLEIIPSSNSYLRFSSTGDAPSVQMLGNGDGTNYAWFELGRKDSNQDRWQMSMAADGSNRLRFIALPTALENLSLLPGGNVGIGATLPNAKLSIQGNVGIGYTGVNQVIPVNGLAVFGNVGIGTTTANSNLSISGNAHIGTVRQGIAAPTDGLFVDGNVGIGATTSSNKLDVWGNARIAGTLTVDSTSTFGQSLTLSNGQFLAPNGTSALPSFSFSGDTDTGLWNVGTNLIALTTNGAGALQTGSTINGLSINSSGNIGIGTTSQAAKLSIYDSTTGVGASALKLYNDNGSTLTETGISFFANAQAGSPNVSVGRIYGKYTAGGWGNQRMTIQVGNSAGVFQDVMQLTSAGNVGIGVTNPDSMLQVRTKGMNFNGFTGEANAGAFLISSTTNGGGSLSAPESALVLGREGINGQAYSNIARFDLSRYENVSTNSRTRLDIRLSNGKFDTEGNNTPVIMSLLSSGNVGIGVTTPGTALAVSGNGVIGFGGATSIAGPANGLAVSGNVGIGTTTANSNLSVAGSAHIGSLYQGIAAPTDGLFVDGNVGIGATSTAYNLDVWGTGRFSSALTVGGNVGIGSSLTVTSGTVLSGGLAVTGGSVVLPSGSINNSELENSSITVSATAGTGISVSGSPVSLGGTLTVSGIDASTSVKGVASFNSTNFSVSSGAVNTIQDIATSATPTFVGLSLTSGNLGIGTSATGAKLQVNGNGIFWPSTTALTGPSFGLATFGNVGIGTTTASQALDVIGAIALNHSTVLQQNVSLNNLFVGSEAGNIGAPATGIQNTFVGIGVGTTNASGDYNTFVGYLSGNKNLTGDENSFFGYQSGFSNTTGSMNTFVGIYSGNKNTTGSTNSFFGRYSGFNNTTGISNAFFGNESGEANVSGRDNSFFGTSSGISTTGSYNSFFGSGSGQTNAGGGYNSAFGYRSGFSNASGSYNLFLGTNAGYNELGSSKLYIYAGSSGTARPLIYGDFSAGNVGIGTTAGTNNTPPARLQLEGAGSTTGLTFLTGGLGYPAFGVAVLDNGNVGIGTTGAFASGTKLAVMGGNVGIGTTTANSNLSISGNAHIGSIYQGIVAPTNGLFVDGNVGIGATTSSNILDVWGNARVTGTLTVDGTSTFDGGNFSLASGQFLTPNGTNSLPSYSFTNSTSTGMYSPSANALALNTNGASTPPLTITAGGNVGIGITNPTATLQIGGTGTFSTGTGAVSLNGNTTIAANKNLIFASGTGSYAQTFSGTTQTPWMITSTHAPTAGGTQSVTSLTITNNPSTNANTLNAANWSITESSNLANTINGLKIAFTDSGTGASIKNGLNIDVTTANPNDSTYAAILQGGNVGIGASLPQATLVIQGNVGIGYTGVNQVIPANGLAVFGNVGIGTTTANSNLSISGNAHIGGLFQGIAAPANGLFVDGNVGIGATTSSNKLDVWGNSRIAGNLTVDGTTTYGGNLTLSSGQFLAPDGTASLPSYSFTNSTSTGMYSPSANALALNTNGASTPPLTITAGGNVGIGTTSPAAPLHIVGVTAQLRLSGNGTTQNAAIDFYPDTPVGTGYRGQILVTHGTDADAGTLNMKLNNTSGTLTTRLYIEDGGNLGIGTDTTPDYLLELYDATNTPAFGLSDDDIAHGVTTVANTDTFFHLSSISTTDGGAYLQGIADNVADATALQLRGIQSSDPTDSTPAIKLIGAKANGTGVQDLGATETVLQIANNDDIAALTILGNGNVGIGATIPNATLSIQGNVGIGYTGANQVIPSNGLAVFGNVGIGTTSPNSKLSVIGGGIFTNTWGGAIAPTAGLIVEGNTGIGVSAPVQQFQVNPTGSSAFVVTSGGNIGIGMTSPTAKLQLNNGQLKLSIDAGRGDTDGRIIIDGRGSNPVNPALFLYANTSANAPSINFYDDTGTTVYGRIMLDRSSSPVYTGTAQNDFVLGTESGTNKLHLGTNSIARLTVDSAGNIGIGITTANSTLSVAGSAHIGTIRQGIAAPTNGLFVDGNVGIGATTSTNKLDVWGNAAITGNLTLTGNLLPASDDTFDLGSDTARWNNLYLGPATLHLGTSTSDEYTLAYDTTNNRLGFNVNGSGPAEIVMDSNGNVGIGTTGPVAKLEVDQTSGDVALFLSSQAATDAGIRFRTNQSNSSIGLVLDNSNTNKAAGMRMQPSDGALTFNTGLASGGGLTTATEKMQLDTNGNLGIGTQSPIAQLDVRNTSTGTGLHTYIGSSGGQFGILNNGNVGIGTTTPGEALHVVDNNGRGIKIERTSATASSWSWRIQSGGQLQLVQDSGGANDILIQPTAAKSLIINEDSADVDLRIESDNNVSAFFLEGSSGNIGIGTSSPLSLLSVAGNAHIGSVRQGISAPTDGLFVDGNVGIGATTSSNKLDVWGNANITGTLNVASNLFQINSSGYALLPLGLVGSPALSFVGDPDTGLWSYAANTLNFSTGGVVRATIDTNGNVGIGTSLPTAALDVAGATSTITNSSGNLTITSASSLILSIANGNVGIGTSAAGAALQVNGGGLFGWGTASVAAPANGLAVSGNVGIGTTSPIAPFHVWGNGTNSAIFANGNVGIGTAAPLSKLDVRATGDNADVTMAQLTNDDNPLTTETGQSTSLIFNVMGTTNSGTSYAAATAAVLRAGKDADFFGADATDWDSNLQFRVSKDGSSFEAMRITSAGSVGIGSTSPQAARQLTLNDNGGNQLDLLAFSIAEAEKALIGYDVGGGSLITSTANHLKFTSAGGMIFAAGAAVGPTSTSGMYIASAGNVGVGNTAPITMLTVGSPTNTGNITVYGTATTCTIGNGTSATNCSSSDIRLKDNITALADTSGLEVIMALNPVSFNWNQWMQSNGAPSSTQFGFIAQDVQNVFPNLVHQDASTGYYTLDYQGLAAPMIRAIQEQQAEINNLLAQQNTSSTLLSGLAVSSDGTLNAPEIKTGKLVLSTDINFAASPLNALISTTGGTGITSTTGGGYEVDVLASLNSISSAVLGIQSQESTTSAQLADLQTTVATQSANLASLESNIASQSATTLSLAQQLASAAAELAQTRSDVEELKLTPPDILLATQSAQLVDLKVTSDATISGQLTTYDLDVQNALKSLGTTTLGSTLVAGDFTIDGTLSLTGSSISTLSTLYIQNGSMAGPVDFFNGEVTIDKNGVLAINKLELPAEVLGEAIIPAGSLEIPVFTEAVTQKSKVFLTPTTLTGGQPLIMSEIISGSGFVVALEKPFSSDIKFNWVILDQR